MELITDGVGDKCTAPDSYCPVSYNPSLVLSYFRQAKSSLQELLFPVRIHGWRGDWIRINPGGVKAVIEHTVLHHIGDGPGVIDILQRVFRHDNHIGQFAHLD